MQFWKSKFHFVGIGGIGMCGLAEILARGGAQVTGSDLSENANTERLKSLGVRIFVGHSASQVGDVDVVVYSSAISMDNPEMVAARQKKIPLIPRAEALAEMMRLKRGVAVGGTHGKTTTTGMVASVFMQAKAQPTIVIGGRLPTLQSTAQAGEGDWLIAEADESDGSFQKLTPEISIITNIDSDHLDYFKTFEALKAAFVSFGMKTAFYGSVIVCGDDPATRRLFENFPKRVWFYGFDPQNDFVVKRAGTGAAAGTRVAAGTEVGEGAANGMSVYELHWHGRRVGEFQVAVPGKHNGLNATAAILAGMKAGFSFEVCRDGIAAFQGVDRRFQLKGEAKGISVYDDYGHHPTEIRATLEACRDRFPNRRIVVMFQPHRYSRTQFCWNEFLTCFSEADLLFVTDIYPAGEKPIAGVTGEALTESIKHPNKLFFGQVGKAPAGPSSLELAQCVNERLKPGDVFLTLGAGDGYKVGMQLLDLLRA